MTVSDAEIGREEAKERRALGKALRLALGKHAKGTGWQVSQGVLFRDFSGWFLSAPTAVWIGRRKTQAELFCKPMALDPVFWEVVEAESNATLPLSFRYHGAWTCSTPSLLEHEIDERGGDVASIAAQALSWLNGQTSQFSTWTTNQFLRNLQQHPRCGSYIATIVTTMLLLREYDKAAAICGDAIRRRDACGFTISRLNGPSQTFPELALAWLDRKRASFH
jgi:hypothetical protein